MVMCPSEDSKGHGTVLELHVQEFGGAPNMTKGVTSDDTGKDGDGFEHHSWDLRKETELISISPTLAFFYFCEITKSFQFSASPKPS